MGFDSIRNNPKQLSRPMSRQAFRPGQWNGVRIGSDSITYIQNNFDGTSTSYRGWGEAWTTYDSCPPPCNNDSNKMSILGWIGLGTGLFGGILGLFGGGTGLLGGILGLFGGGKKSETSSENGGVEPQAQAQTQSRTVAQEPETEPEVTTPAAPAPASAPAAQPAKTSTATAPVDQPKPEPTVDNYDWDSGFETYAMDEEVGGKSPTEEISGKINVTEKGEAGKAPQEFTLTDGNNTYTFKKIEGKDGKVSYKCTGCTGDKNKTYTKGNVYECILVNGKPVLVQPKEAEGWGKGLDRSNP